MIRYVIWCVAAITISSSTFCSAAVKAMPPTSQLLMTKSGVNKQVEQLPSMMLYSLDQAYEESKSPLPPGAYEKLKEAVASSFSADSILASIEQKIDDGLNKYDIEAILQWLESPLGVEITKLEESASSASAYESMKLMKEGLLKDAARVEKIKKLDAAIKGTESSLDLAINTQIAVASAMAAVLAPEDPTVLDQIIKGSMAGRKQMESSVKDMTLVSFLYTYRTLKDDEIDRYTKFLSSDLGRRYVEVMKDGLDTGLLRASRDLGKSFAQTLN